ncbi:MAG: endo-1,4-beta-xylanase [Verrucomicrobiota bacterium JB022]|nr:endo-1,4-beta-xylanase [Verrucomicrobiota bacterium JB022]
MKHSSFFCTLPLWLGASLGAQQLLTIEAESGQFGSNMTAVTEGDLSWAAILNTGAGNSPGSDANIVTIAPEFAEPGTYELYARIYVGPGTYSDDSLFLPRDFGDLDPAADAAWSVVNGLAAAMGYAQDSDLVGNGGTVGSEAWKWVKLSTGEAPILYLVTEDNLSPTFQFGGREDGLRIDKFAFGPEGVAYTVAELTAGEGEGTIIPEEYVPSGPPLATGKSKYLGSVHSASQVKNFEAYFNQVTAENGGKWGSVEATRDVMNWTDLDAAYQLAQDTGSLFRMHVLVWGAQQPSWISTLPVEEKREEIEEWFHAVAERYPQIDYLEVVNEPLHAPPNGEYAAYSTNVTALYYDALGGYGESGHDWILEAFRMAREIFPETRLVLNDYGIIGNNTATTNYLEIITDLQAEGLIDVIGVQGHAFETTGTVETMKANLDRLAATGLPIIITEMDVDGTSGNNSDAVQLANYQRIFPMFWEHPAIEGVTLWGYRIGLWRTDTEAYLVDDYSYERPALEWLREYIAASETWYGYDISMDFADTGDWLGLVNVAHAPWVKAGGNWIWIEDGQDAAQGVWGYLQRPAEIPEHPDATGTWLDYPQVGDWAYTGDWMGWVYVSQAPWIWTPTGWTYIQPGYASANGCWGWLAK